jgi:hypothetical protein
VYFVPFVVYRRSLGLSEKPSFGIRKVSVPLAGLDKWKGNLKIADLGASIREYGDVDISPQDTESTERTKFRGLKYNSLCSLSFIYKLMGNLSRNL